MHKNINSIYKNTDNDENLTFYNLYIPLFSNDNYLNLNQFNSIHSSNLSLNHEKNNSYLEKKRFRTFESFLNEETESKLIYKAVNKVFNSNTENE